MSRLPLRWSTGYGPRPSSIDDISTRISWIFDTVHFHVDRNYSSLGFRTQNHDLNFREAYHIQLASVSLRLFHNRILIFENSAIFCRISGAHTTFNIKFHQYSFLFLNIYNYYAYIRVLRSLHIQSSSTALTRSVSDFAYNLS